MATFPETLSTERLHLRRLHADDAPGVFAYASDPDAYAHFMTFPVAQVPADVQAFLTAIEPLMNDGKECHWGMRLDADADVIGVVSLTRSAHGLEFGYVLNKAHWGNGYMPEAVRALMQWAFEVEQAPRVWATCHVDNERSTHVLQKVGMQQEGILRNWLRHPNLDGEVHDCRVFSILPDEWAASTLPAP